MEVILEAEIQHGNIAHIWRGIEMVQYAITMVLVIRSGGITRFKYHLSHSDPHSNTKKCPNVPPEVKQEMKQLLD